MIIAILAAANLAALFLVLRRDRKMSAATDALTVAANSLAGATTALNNAADAAIAKIGAPLDESAVTSATTTITAAVAAIGDVTSKLNAA